MKIDPADRMFSIFIRTRDRRCVRCGKAGTGNNGIDGLQCSHYFGRDNEAVRYDVENCDSLCYGCHRYWEKRDRESYRAFKIKQLGENRFNALMIRSHSYYKKDRKLELIKASELLKTIKQQRVLCKKTENTQEILS